MQHPFIFVSERMTARIPDEFDDQSGVRYKEVVGEHALWAARVPFLPHLMSEDFARRPSQERIEIIGQRQARFIYDLARARDQLATFDLRFITRPSEVEGQPNPVEIVFFGKIFSTRPKMTEAFALELWERFSATFPLEDPFNFPLQPVTDPDDFHRYHLPVRTDGVQVHHIADIRKFEDMPEPARSPLSRQPRIGDYIAHPLVPTTSFPPLGRFIEALSRQEQVCVVSVSLRPVVLFPQELQNIGYQIARFREIRDKTDSIADEFIRARASIGEKVYNALLLDREHLMLSRITVLGADRLPQGLAEALGSEMMDNGRNEFPTQWTLIQPGTDVELGTALNNLVWLEHDPWGSSVAAAQLQRLRYLVNPGEATGAFRLPIPPESGYMPGVLVKNEPFVAPSDYLEETSRNTGHLPSIDLGYIYHRGEPTSQLFSVPLDDLMRHGMIAGSTGAGKTTTILNILSQLWTRYRIPFMVLYPVDKPDYRKLRQTLGDDLLVFTLGDETTSPFRFNPFEVPDGLLLKTHLSRLMRAFSAAFSLFDPLPMIYRDALRRVYSAHHWHPATDRGEHGRTYPIMSEFYAAIDEVTSELRYGRETQDSVRQASVIRIGDLLENAGHAVNVRESMSISKIMQYPTVFEVGRVGSTEDTALLMGFLLLRLTAEIERRPREGNQRYVMVVEEAHRLMTDAHAGRNAGIVADPRQMAGEDFSNVLAEIRGFDVGVMIAEQIPALLVRGAIGNTFVKIMHWLEDVSSFELFSDIMNLSDTQRMHARTLTAGHAIVRSPFGRPVHVKITDPFADAQQPYQIDLSDDAVRQRMAKVMHNLDITSVPIEPWSIRLGASKRISDDRTAAAILSAPMRTCAYCQPLVTSRRCPYRREVVKRVSESDDTSLREAVTSALSIPDIGERWSKLAQIGRLLAGDGGSDKVYCYFAHLTEQVLQATEGDDRTRQLRRQFRRLLIQFGRLYRSEGSRRKT